MKERCIRVMHAVFLKLHLRILTVVLLGQSGSEHRS